MQEANHDRFPGTVCAFRGAPALQSQEEEQTAQERLLYGGFQQIMRRVVLGSINEGQAHA